MLTSLLASVLMTAQSPISASRLVDGTNDSGMTILARSYAERPGNVMVSPLSIAMCLAMVESGARGKTRDGIDQAIGWPVADREGISASVLPVADMLMNAGGDQMRMDIANSVWTNQNIPVDASFADLVRDRFRARVTSLNFGDKVASLNAINGWVSEQTRGKIPTILDDIDAGMLMVLVNAISFKAEWAEQFSPRSTRPLPFTGLDGKTADVPMMSRGGGMRYLERPDSQTIFLPYKAGGYQMAVVLPAKGTDFPKFVAGFDAAKFREIEGAADFERGSVTLPKWKSEFRIELKKILASIGMELAFRPGAADFSGMSKVPSHIDYVIHKTFIAVDETGTEAAAVTATGMRAGSAAPRNPFTFVVDRPFMYVIFHEPSGMICFAGTVVRP